MLIQSVVQFEPPRDTKEYEIPLQLGHARNHKFTGRENLLFNLHQTLTNTCNGGFERAVLYGVGGVGKSQIALEYAYRHDFEYTAIFWVDASSYESTLRSYHNAVQLIISHYEVSGLKDLPRYLYLADAMNRSYDLMEPKIAIKGSSIDIVMEAFIHWLSIPENDHWLLIYDNADDLESFNIQKYFPSTPWGKTIITSRRPELAAIWEGIEVDEMSKIEAFDLLQRSANLKLMVGSKGMSFCADPTSIANFVLRA
jgi:hypothetical protein